MAKVSENIKERLVEKSVSFFAPVKRNNTKTFATLYNCHIVSHKDEKKVIKADRRLIQQLLNTAQAGRNINMEDVLRHVLSPIPLSLASIDGKMNSVQKSDLLSLLPEKLSLETSTNLPQPKENKNSCIIIDGHALIQALGKPATSETFKEYGDIFISMVARKFTKSVRRIDVVFDRYIGKDSIKIFTRTKRTGKTKRPIRKAISDGNVPMPQVWAQFISSDENKAELAEYLSERLIDYGSRMEPTKKNNYGWWF